MKRPPLARVRSGAQYRDSGRHDPPTAAPLHLAHLASWCPQVLRYLGLPPGWRFLIAADYEDVWEDPSLLA